MSDLPAVIAALARELPEVHVRAWAQILRGHPAPHPAIRGLLTQARTGAVMGARAARLIAAWSAADPPPPGSALALALETASRMHGETHRRRTDIVVSGPHSDEVPVRLTSSVIIEVIRASRTSLLVVSFAAFGVAEVTRELVRAARRGVQIDLVLEGTVEDGGALRGASTPPFEVLRPLATFWVWADRPRTGGSVPALHAKVVAADEEVALLGSANLTDRALAHNLEVGVVLRDPDVVGRLVRHFHALMHPKNGPLRPTTARH
ncbi:DISARM system phospholipase D-like protein DrmC [Streptosporangium sp. NBC_01810]|uniref:DISARM system phospholipase D-like protein DrmC n=1 Tax=Streptosporangium sp. NBC_01810 TaxID=2975951 RepID=UPI002DDB4F38|nr:DISARM system phospholipase D-like protein DrmC [Streptosporangium sp. NBC_01810]WSA23297.1 DISARM system phospholipase D-like protein DrmC [Streptosporangium sp. NBC_01810]